MVPSTIDRTQGGRLPIGWPHVESVRLRLRQTTFASEKPRWSIGSGGAFCAQGSVRTGVSLDPGFSRSGVLSAAERAPAPVGPCIWMRRLRRAPYLWIGARLPRRRADNGYDPFPSQFPRPVPVRATWCGSRFDPVVFLCRSGLQPFGISRPESRSAYGLRLTSSLSPKGYP